MGKIRPMDSDNSPPRLQESDLDVSDSLIDVKPPEIKNDLIEYFKEVEKEYELQSFSEWRIAMIDLRQNVGAEKDFSIIHSLLVVVENKVGSQALDKPNGLLLIGSRFGKPKHPSSQARYRSISPLTVDIRAMAPLVWFQWHLGLLP